MKKILLLLLTSFILANTSLYGQTSGCCTITTTASCGPINKNVFCIAPNPITFVTGVNGGTGSCTIPAGAVITTCRVTISNPSLTNATLPADLTHADVLVYTGSTGATNNMSVIGAGITINFDPLGGCPVAGTSFSVRITGTAVCAPNHDHTASVNVSVALCWQSPQQTFYQAAAGLQGTYLGNCMQNLNCAATLPYVFADDGNQATGGFYSSSINNIYRTFCPNTAGKCVNASVEYYSLETTYDFLRVINGPTQNSTLITSLNGAKAWGTPVVYTSTDSSGCLSFRFVSDATNTAGGFYITLNCVDCAVARNLPTSDCIGAIATCGSTTFAGTSNGPGLTSSCSGCVVSENYTTWYFFEIATSGTLALTIDATDNTDDYDFALYQSNDCNTLGTPVRCSYAAITATGSTGMVSTAVDLSEIASGDGWVDDLAVTAGQTYVLMVNNWSPGDAGYNLNFFLTNGGTFDDCSVISLPVEMLEFTGTCKNGLSELSWTTATELNNNYWAILKSTDNTVFKTSGYVMGAGNSNEIRNYYFKDPEENTGTVYYKLKQVDFDGYFSYSDLVTVYCKSEELSDLVVRDRQDEGYLSISFNSLPGVEYTIIMIALNGELCYEAILKSVQQKSTFDIPVFQLPTGIYRVSVQTNSSMLQKKVLIY